MKKISVVKFLLFILISYNILQAEISWQSTDLSSGKVYGLAEMSNGDILSYTAGGICNTCSGETDGTGTIVDNDADDDGVCDHDSLKTAKNNLLPDCLTMEPIYPNSFN